MVLRPKINVFIDFLKIVFVCLAGSAYKHIGKRVMKPAQRAPMSTKLCMHLDMIKSKVLTVLDLTKPKFRRERARLFRARKVDISRGPETPILSATCRIYMFLLMFVFAAFSDQTFYELAHVVSSKIRDQHFMKI